MINRQMLCLAAATAFVWSCANITVNVYFPSEKDVEEAYDDIEDILSEEVETEPAESEGATGVDIPSKFGIAPQSAWAKERRTNPVTAELKKMKDVIAAQKRRNGRYEKIRSLMDAAVIGLMRTGHLALMESSYHDTTAPEILRAAFGEEGDTALREFLNYENEDREILIRGMALAVLRAGGDRNPSQKELQEEMEDSRRLFWKKRRKELETGHFYQDIDGKWVKKAEPEK